MKYLIHLSTLLIIATLGSTTYAQLEGSKTKPFIKPDETKTHFGAELTLKQKPIGVDEAISQFKTKKSAGPFLLEAQIDQVCKKKGCWMTIKSKSRDMRVIFKDYSFFVPVSITGKNVLVEGSVTEKQLTLAETKHFVEDAGGDPSKVTEPMMDYQFVASGVKVIK
jgi:hypothetical protein